MFLSNAGATLAAAVALMTIACGDTEPAAPTTPAVANPRYLYTNGPSTPNVFRFSGDDIALGLSDDRGR